MGVGDSWEDPRAGESIVHPCLVVARYLALHAVATFTCVLGKVPEGQNDIEKDFRKASPCIGSVILNLVSSASIV